MKLELSEYLPWLLLQMQPGMDVTLCLQDAGQFSDLKTEEEIESQKVVGNVMTPLVSCLLCKELQTVMEQLTQV